jgi:hypothetical protein
MLLTGRSSSGMSAPVGGQDGAIPLAAGADEPIFQASGDAPVDKATDAPEAQVDLRWLAARAARSSGSEAASAGKTGLVRPRSGVLIAAPVAGEGDGLVGTIAGATPGGGKKIAAPIVDPVDGGEGTPPDGWTGPVAPLPNAGPAMVQATYPVATKLSSVLRLLQTGSAHAAR